MATGRSDYPNQVNNVLGFPFIFRGALDVRASAINEEMKMAASHALAELAKEDVPEAVLKAYGVKQHVVRPRVPDPEAVRPARAARGRRRRWRRPRCDTGVARKPITDWDAYRESLERMLGPSREVMHFVMHKAQQRQAEAARVPRGRARLHHPRRPRHRRSEDRDARCCSGIESVIRDSAKRLGIEQIDFEIVNVPDPKHDDAYARDAVRAAPAQGHDAGTRRPTWCTIPTICGLMMVQHRRRRRVRRRHGPRLPGDDPAGHPDSSACKPGVSRAVGARTCSC